MTNTNIPTKAKESHLLYPELSYTIMEAAFEVHNQLGPGFTEDIYEQALKYELGVRNISFEYQKMIRVSYKGVELGVYRLDLIIENAIIVEIKAVSTLLPVHKQQLLAYLKATGLRLGILINFGSSRVESQRIAN